MSQVREDYNNFGQVTMQYQEHSGSVNTSTSLKVQYAYASGTNYSRLSSETYPNGRVLDYVYNSGIDTNISRVSQLNDDAGTGAGSVEAYTYLGLDTIVQRADGNGINLTYIKQSGESDGAAGDRYIGLDTFGRVIDQRWIPASTPTSPTDRFQYGYDRAGNVLYKDNKIKSSFSELYHANSSASGDNNTAYDNLNRLTGFRRGTLSASANNSGGLDTVTTLNANSKSSQSFTLDAVGNQTGVTTDGTAQTNTVNSQNQETGFGTSTLVFDNNGNTTTDDQGHTLVYDAWNRLVAVKNGGTTLVNYAYDAYGNRISRTASGTTTDLYNSAAGQVLEERQSSTVTNQYLWSIAYVNAMVLRDDNSSGGSYGKSSSGLGRRLYVQQDANFNVTALTNTSGTVQQRFAYSPYGLMTVVDNTTNWTATTDSYSWVYTFQGGRYDATTGMIHFGAREYSPTLGRWLQNDPAGYVDGANRYQYTDGDPEVKVDPTGRDYEYYTTDGGTFSIDDPNFVERYVNGSQWGASSLDGTWVKNNDGTYTFSGRLHTNLKKLELPKCVSDDQRKQLQKAVDDFNAATSKHEADVRESFQKYLSNPQKADSKAKARTDADNDTKAIWKEGTIKEDRALAQQYGKLRDAISACACSPNLQATLDALNARIKTIQDRLSREEAATQPSSQPTGS